MVIGRNRPDPTEKTQQFGAAAASYSPRRSRRSNGGPILIGSQSKAHKSSPPPAPVGLRGVAVVQRDECAATIERN
jgi:hypothetical protein